MYSFIFVVFVVFFQLGETFYTIVPQFNAANIGSNTIVHDAIMINSNQNLIISYNQNGVQYISRFLIQSGGLVLQLMIPVTTYNHTLVGEAITVLCVNNIQTQLMAFTGNNYQLYLLDINTLNKISTSSVFSNITQMIWSSVNNNIYFVDQDGMFGYLDLTINICTSVNLYSITPGLLRMSVSPNYKYMAITSKNNQFILIYNIIDNNYWDSKDVGENNAIAHEWISHQMLYIFPPTLGYLYNYNASSLALDNFYCFPNGNYNITSFHMHILSDSSQQIIVASYLNMILSFYKFDINLLTLETPFDYILMQDIVQIKYSKSSPEKGLLIFNSFIESINILEPCQIGQIFDPSINRCVVNAINIGTNNLSITQLSVDQQKIMTNVISLTTSNPVIKSCNYLPGNRRLLQPIFIFFVNFDDIQLYVYHQRQYDFVLDTLFQTVQNLQNEKWSLIKFEYLWGFIGFNTTLVKENFNTKFNYTSWKFIQVQGYSSGFMINTLNLFLSNILLVFLMFVVLRTVFFLLFKYQISKILRQYSFWPYLYFLMIDGNLQFLSYMYLCELQHFFSSNFSNKCGLVFMICIFLVLILLISCSHLLLRQTYGLLAKYFFEDTKTSFQASIYLILQFGYRNFLLGAVHALFNKNYLLKISLLLSVQVCFMINGLFFLRKRNFFSNETRITVNIVAALLRICMIFTFMINTQEQKMIEQMTTLSIILEKVHFIIVIIYLLIGIFSTGFQLSKMMYEILSFIQNKKKDKKQLQINKNQQLKTTQFTFQQNKIQKSCVFQQFQFKSIKNIDKKKISQYKNNFKGKTFNKFLFKGQYNKSLKIKEIKQPQRSKKVQHVTFVQNKIDIINQAFQKISAN